MTDTFTTEKRSEIMSRVRSVDTSPEITVRRRLFHLGFRYRLHRRDLPGSPDLALPKYKTVIFIHGCFWHAHDCDRQNVPKSNSEYWINKFTRNKERDKKNIGALLASGWRCVIIWECALKRRYIEETILRVQEFIIAGEGCFLGIGKTSEGVIEERINPDKV